MTTMSAPSASARSGDSGSTVPRRSGFATRRRLLLLGCLLLLVVVAIAANYGPMRHYRDARARLEKTTAEVAALEEQKAALRSQLGRLGQADYLESLARQELTYARPGEDLYIITGLPGGDFQAEGTAGYSGSTSSSPGASTRAGIGAAAAGVRSGASETGLGIGASWPDVGGAGTSGVEGPGLLERILSTIARVF